MNIKKIIKKLYPYLIFIVFTFLFLHKLDPKLFNFWVDFTGTFEINKTIINNLFSIDSNNLGLFSFYNFSNITYYLFIRIFTIFNIKDFFNTNYILLFFIVFINLISSYFLIKKITKEDNIYNKIFSIIFPLFYISNPIFIHYLFITGTISINICFAILNLILILLLNFNINKNYKNIIFLSILTSLIPHPFIFALSFISITIYLIFTLDYKNTIKYIITTILINFYWILPFVTSNLFNGLLFGSYTTNLIKSYSDNSEYYKSLTFLGKNFENFNTLIYFDDCIKSYAFLIINSFIWFIIIFKLTIKNHFKNNKIIRNFSLFLISFLLVFSIGPKKPLGFIYDFMINNFSFFSAFRSFSNSLVILFVFIFFLVIVLYRKNKKIITILSFFSFVLFVLFMFSNIPNKSFSIPSEYNNVKKIIDSKNNSINRVMILPYSIYDYYNWGNGISDKYFLTQFFKNSSIVYYKPIMDNTFIENLFNSNNIDEEKCTSLSNANIDYILIRKDLENNKHDINNIPHTDTIKIKCGDVILDSKNLSLYKLNKSFVFDYEDNFYYKYINPTKYRITLNITKEKSFIFKNNFNSGWGLYLNQNPTNSWCEKLEEYNNDGNIVTECKHEQKFFEGEELSYLYKKPTFQDSHKVVYDYANGWTIDPEYIKKNFDKSYYKENPDGSIDIELTLYFKPQSYFYLGLIISGTTLVGCITYLIIDGIRNKKKKDDVIELQTNSEDIKK